MVCLVLASLCVLQLALATKELPWSHVMPPADFAAEPYRPIYTCRYLEWLICVPGIMAIMGRFTLFRPWSDILPAMMMALVYISLNWLGLVATSWELRASLVSCACVVAMWSFVCMIRWGVSFLHATAPSLPGRNARIALLVSQVTMYLSCGVVNVLAMFGYIDAAKEELAHTFTDVTCKALIVGFVNGIRVISHNQLLVSWASCVERQIYMIKSVLMSSFDVVLPCALDESGHCCIDSEPSRHLSQLETLLNCKLGGCSLNEWIVERDLFESYVRNSWRQAFSSAAPNTGNEPRDGGGGSFLEGGFSHDPPVAQVMQLHLHPGPGPHDEEAKVQPPIRVTLHLSAIICSKDSECDTPLPALLALSPSTTSSDDGDESIKRLRSIGKRTLTVSTQEQTSPFKKKPSTGSANIQEPFSPYLKQPLLLFSESQSDATAASS